tara:strand:- start:1204 stop:1698 length:495 start_codon:yes stop_codon:yes gene_type:complete
MGVTLGIDVGFGGALAFVSDDPKWHEVYDTPIIKVGSRKELDMPRLAELVTLHGKGVSCYVESVGALPRQGVTSMFRFGTTYGAVQGAAAAAGHRMTLVKPRTWQAVMLRDMPKGKDKIKGSSLLRAKQLFPEAILQGPRGGPLDGRSDALLIARYGQQKEIGS